MECVAFDVEISHFGVAYLDALGVSIGVEFAADRQTGLSNQLDNSQAARRRPAKPILRDVTEQAVLDPVPWLGCFFGRNAA